MSEEKSGPLALTMLSGSKTVNARAKEFLPSIQRQLQEKVISPLLSNVEKLKDRLCDLEDFSLATNLNAGQTALTREQCNERFEEIINVTYELNLAELEYKAKLEAFNKYFS